MKLNFNFSDEDKRIPLPKGKLSVRWVKSRNFYQCYVGGRYLTGAAGETEQEALGNLKLIYK
jgi:hypothetical protein